MVKPGYPFERVQLDRLGLPGATFVDYLRFVQAVLTRYGMCGSMSRKGDCWNNAVMERFFLNLKMERVWQRDYANHAEAQNDADTEHLVRMDIS